MAMQVGENLMNLGVQLLTRGHDLRMAASRHSSLVGSTSCSPKSCHSKRTGGSATAAGAGAAAYADCLHQDATTAVSASAENGSHFAVEGDLGVILNEKLRALTACHHHSQLSLPSQVLCDAHANDDEEDDGFANSDIESLSGEVEPDWSHSKRSNSTTHGDGRPSENIISSGLDQERGKEKSFNSLALQHSSGTLIQEEALLPMGDNNPKKGKKKLLEDRWSCLQLNFSDHKASHPKKNASEKSK